jgi:uncharacterized repeat protein (TIGR04052 family)
MSWKVRTLALTCGALAAGCSAGAPVEVKFAARFGDADAACGTTYDAIGATASSVELLDLRAYISGLKIDGAGTIDAEAPWQAEDVALLDFEDKTGACTGNVDLRSVVRGLAPSDSGTLEFDLGVPESLNHLDPAKLTSPLNVSSMFWGWTAGFRFLRLDMATTGQPGGWVVHLGSSGCAGVTGGNAACTEPNRVHVTLDGWTPDSTVVLDLSTLVAGADVDVNTENTGPGCMSEPDDPECVGVFEALGLPLGDRPAGEQTVFSLESP